MNLPRYDSHSIEELRAGESTINRKKFPERYEAVRLEIKHYERETPEQKSKRAWRARARRRFHALFMGVWCVCGVCLIAPNWIERGTTPQQVLEPWLALPRYIGIPLVLGVGAWLHFFCGVRIIDGIEPRER